MKKCQTPGSGDGEEGREGKRGGKKIKMKRKKNIYSVNIFSWLVSSIQLMSCVSSATEESTMQSDSRVAHVVVYTTAAF